MTTLAQPHVDEASPRRILLRTVRTIAIAVVSGLLAALAGLALRHLPVEGLVIAPRMMVPL